jgi:hypothetical protein
MNTNLRLAGTAVLLGTLSSGCQVVNTGTETRTEEQMLRISFENAEAEKTFAAIIYGTERETHVKARIGAQSIAAYSRTETVGFNAHCNDCIRAMDKNSDLLITQKEAEDHYQELVKQGRIARRK